MIGAYQTLINRLRSAGIAPKQHILDNECSSDFKEDDPSHRTGELSNKRFTLPSSMTMQATEIAEYPFEVRAPAK